MKKIMLLLLPLLVAAGGASAQIKKVNGPAEDIALYSRADIDVELGGRWENPYDADRVTLDLLVETPSGASLTVPCFFVGDAQGKTSKWQARYTPRETGAHTYRLRLTEAGKAKSESKPATLTVTPGDAPGMLATRDFWTLGFDNGTPFRGIGENICWESRDNDDSRYFKSLHEMHEKYNYDYLLPQFSENGGNFIRVWMCSWNFPIDQQSGFNNSRYTDTEEYMNPSAVARLDHFLRLCEDLGIYVMLCMGQGAVPADHGFFTDPAAKKRYRDRARYIIARWGYSPALGMWEFLNEIDNIQFRRRNDPIPAADIVSWHTEMCEFFRATDPYGHILTTSISHRDIEGLNSIPLMDINQKHIYNNTSALPAEIATYTEEFGKPYIIGEFGYEWDWSKNFDDFAGDMDIDFKRGLWYGLFSPTPVTPMSWWWEYFENRGMVPYFRGVRMISDMMLADGGGSFTPLETSAGGAESFAVKCGETVYAYLYNASGETVKENFSIEVRGNRYEVREFDPLTLAFADRGRVSGVTGIHYTEMDMAPKTEKVLVFTPVTK